MIVTETSSAEAEFGLPVCHLFLSEMGATLDTRVRQRSPSFPPDAGQYVTDSRELLQVLDLLAELFELGDVLDGH